MPSEYDEMGLEKGEGRCSVEGRNKRVPREGSDGLGQRRTGAGGGQRERPFSCRESNKLTVVMIMRMMAINLFFSAKLTRTIPVLLYYKVGKSVLEGYSTSAVWARCRLLVISRWSALASTTTPCNDSN